MALSTPIRRSRRSGDFDPPSSVKAPRAQSVLAVVPDISSEKEDGLARVSEVSASDLVKLHVLKGGDGNGDSTVVEFLLDDHMYRTDASTFQEMVSSKDGTRVPPKRSSVREFIHAQKLKRKSGLSIGSARERQVKRKVEACSAPISQESAHSEATVCDQMQSSAHVPLQITRADGDDVELLIGSQTFRTSFCILQSLVAKQADVGEASTQVCRPRRASASEFLAAQGARLPPT